MSPKWPKKLSKQLWNNRNQSHTQKKLKETLIIFGGPEITFKVFSVDCGMYFLLFLYKYYLEHFDSFYGPDNKENQHNVDCIE